MRWSGATGAIARCKRVSTECGRRHRSVPAWPWICGVKPTPKAVNTPSPHSIVHGLDKPGVFTTVSKSVEKVRGYNTQRDLGLKRALLGNPQRLAPLGKGGSKPLCGQ